jgi:uncharacterized membrane protein YcaP (DUF421 family)
MDKLYFWFGEGDHLNALQMSVRAFIMFFITLVLIRMAGMRTFAKKSSFDNILVIMLGAILARGVVGASGFFATIAASTVMVIIHRLLAFLCLKNEKIGKLLKGKTVILYKEDKILWNNMKKTSLSKTDLYESLRLETKKNSLNEIDTALMETNGRISFITKPKEQ